MIFEDFAHMGKRSLLLAVLLLIALSNLDAQTGATEARKFEVASVRRCQNSQSPSGGRPGPQ